MIFFQIFDPKLEGEDSKDYKKRRYGLIKSLWDAIWDKNQSLVPDCLSHLYQSAIANYLPSEPYQECLGYDLEANTDRYLLPTMRLNQLFETKGWKLFQPLSLRKNGIPRHVPINMKALIYLFDYSNFSQFNKAQLINQAKKLDLEDAIWSHYFRLDHKIFRQIPYTFYHRIDTDGVKCSLTFILSKYRHLSFKPKEKVNLTDSTKILTELSDQELERLRGKQMVGGDPGKKNMIQLVDDSRRKLKYTSSQRAKESFRDKNRKALMILKDKLGISDREKELNGYNSKTMSVDKFKDYLKAKWEVDSLTRESYGNIVFRKLRMRGFIYARRSLDRFLSRIGQTFGQDIVIGWGNWSHNGGMKGCQPSLGKGLRRKVAKRYETVIVDEFNTSKKCHWCKCDLANKKGSDGKSLYRCLICSECLNQEGNLGVHRHINRDINGGLNIWECLNEWILNKKRPSSLKRPRSSEKDEVGQAGPLDSKGQTTLHLIPKCV